MAIIYFALYAAVTSSKDSPVDVDFPKEESEDISDAPPPSSVIIFFSTYHHHYFSSTYHLFLFSVKSNFSINLSFRKATDGTCAGYTFVASKTV